MMMSMIINCFFYDLSHVFREKSIEYDIENQFKFPFSFFDFAMKSASTIQHINEFSNSSFIFIHKLNNHDNHAIKYKNKEMNELDKFLKEINRKLYKTKIRKKTMNYQSKILNELNSYQWNFNDDDIKYELLILYQKYIFSFNDEDIDWKEMMFIIENLN